MRPRSWTVLLWVLLVSTTAAARETRQGTVLVAGRLGGAPPVLYVAAGLSSLVTFEDLSEPRALLTPELLERVQVLPVGARSLVVVPVRDLAEGERLLLPVTGRTETGEPLTLTLALATRRDEVDLEARVTFASGLSRRATEPGELGAVAGMLLASHSPDTPPKLALLLPGKTQVSTWTGGVQARVESILHLDGRLFLTVAVEDLAFLSNSWRLARIRLEAGCRDTRKGAEPALPVFIISGGPGPRRQFHTFATRLPEGVGCLSLTLEEDGPRGLRLEVRGLAP